MVCFRSLTPTRYKELIEEANTAADAEKTTTSEADKKEKKEKKDKGKKLYGIGPFTHNIRIHSINVS